ncbi:MAG: methyltransferase domain-containing protein [Flavobacteriales bacterium]|nr:methyltransferase domain-containing protein [Flavobacteriales bacterium]
MSETKRPLSALEAKYEAQKIAFGPIFFQAIMAMRKLGILELICKNRRGIGILSICDQLNLSEYGVRVLLEAAECAGAIEYIDENTVSASMTGFMLNSDPMTNVNLNFVNDVCYQGAKYLPDSILKSKPEGLKVFGNWPTVYEGLSQLPDLVKKSWFEFDHYYSDEAFKEALKIVFKENPGYIFDIGGNTGKWAMACCDHNEKVKVKILDLPGQLEVSKKNIEQKGFMDRVDFFEIDLLDTTQLIPEGADAVWMSQFLDCFSESEIVAILENVRRACSKDTWIYILETFIDNQKFPAAKLCLTGTSLYFTFIANGNSKMYSIGAMERLVNQAGLRVVETFPLIGDSYHTVLKCKINV